MPSRRVFRVELMLSTAFLSFHKKDPLKIFADLVAFMTATSFPVADKKLIACIGLPAVKPLYTEFLRIVEGALIPCIHGTM